METYIEEGRTRTSIKKYFDELIRTSAETSYHLLPEDLVSQSVEMGESVLSSTGAFVINNGEFTGRSPKARCIAEEEELENISN